MSKNSMLHGKLLLKMGQEHTVVWAGCKLFRPKILYAPRNFNHNIHNIITNTWTGHTVVGH